MVAPLAGAWIEIFHNAAQNPESNVAPLAGAWIEIALEAVWDAACAASLPSRERGLKLFPAANPCSGSAVAPLAGAWIEIANGAVASNIAGRRSPRGSVD